MNANLSGPHLYHHQAQEVVRQAKKTSEVRKAHHLMSHFWSGIHVVVIDISFYSHAAADVVRCRAVNGTNP